MNIYNTMEAKLMNYFTYFELIDIVGFAKIVKVPEEVIREALFSGAIGTNNWENLICATVENFSKRNRKEKRALLKLAKQIKENNVEFDREQEQETPPQE